MDANNLTELKAKAEKLGKSHTKNKKIIKNCYGFVPLLIELFGALVTCLCISSLIASTENFAIMTEKIPVLPDIVEFISSFMVTYNLPVWCGTVFSFLVTIFVASIITIFFIIISKGKNNKLEDIDISESTLEQAEKLYYYVEEIDENDKNLDGATEFNKQISSIAFFVCAVIIYFSMCSKVEDGWLFIGIFGLIASLVGWVIFILIRKISVAISKTVVGGVTVLSHDLSTISDELRTEIYAQEQEQNQMQEEIKQEEEKKTRAENLKKGEILYQEAISSAEPDIEKLSLAASFGNPEAAKAIAENLYLQATSDNYTNSEQKQAYEMVYGTLKLLEEYGSHTEDSKIFYLSVCFQLGKFETEADFKNALTQAREIQKSGKLSEHYNTICDSLIPFLVKAVNSYECSDYVESVYSDSSIGFSQRNVCRYLVGDRCAKYCEHYSEQDIKDLCPSCYHINDPQNCSDSKFA